MLTASASIGNQASEVMLDTDADRVVVDLVGDLAAYRPHAKVVILEGAYDDSFDIMLVRRLFPDFAKRVNLVSAGSKRRVGDLYEVLNEAASESGMANRFFAIMDSDAEERRNGESGSARFRVGRVPHRKLLAGSDGGKDGLPNIGGRGPICL